MENEILDITEDKFYDDFNLIDNHLDLNSGFSGKMFETFGLELSYVTEMAKLNRVITIIESDGDEDSELDEDGDARPNMYFVSGMHHVNRLGYLISENPIEYEFECKID